MVTGQMTFADNAGLERRHKETKRERFLREMDQVVPWQRLVALIAPYYPKAGPRGGRKPMPLEQMLRIHFLQQWYAYSDPGMEEALHEIPLLRAFAGMDSGRDLIPDESTILRFRRLLERHDLAAKIFAEVQGLLDASHLILQEGTSNNCSIGRHK